MDGLSNGEIYETDNLADYPEYIPVCASWAYGQWGCQSGIPFDHVIEKFIKGANKTTLPITFIALYGSKPTGMISLWTSDYNGRPNLSPWLSALYVHPFYRHKNSAAAGNKYC